MNGNQSHRIATPENPGSYSKVSNSDKILEDAHEPFDEHNKHHKICCCHSRTLTVCWTTIGLLIALVAFLALFGTSFAAIRLGSVYEPGVIEFTFYVYLLVIAILVLLSQIFILIGIKLVRPHLLIPFLVLFSLALFLEAVPFFVLLCEYRRVQVRTEYPEKVLYYHDYRLDAGWDETKLALVGIVYLVLLNIQAFMIYVVMRCHEYLVKKQTHKRKVELSGLETSFDEHDKQFLVTKGCHSRGAALIGGSIGLVFVLTVALLFLLLFVERKQTPFYAVFTGTLLFEATVVYSLPHILLIIGTKLRSPTYIEASIAVNLWKVVCETMVYIYFVILFLERDSVNEVMFIVVTLIYLFFTAAQIFLVLVSLKCRKYFIRMLKHNLAIKLMASMRDTIIA